MYFFPKDLSENNVAASASSELCGPTDEPVKTLKQREDTLVAIREREPTAPTVSNTNSDADETNSKEEDGASKTIMKPCKETVEISTASKSTVTKVIEKRRISGETKGGKKRKISKDIQVNPSNNLSKNSEQGEVKENTNTVTCAESVSSKTTQKEQNMSEKDKQPNKSVEKVQIISKDTSPSGKNAAGSNSKFSTPRESQLLIPGDKQETKKKRKSKTISKDVSIQENAAVKSNETSNQTATKSTSQLHVDREDSVKVKCPVRGEDHSSGKGGKRHGKKRESNESTNSNGEVSSSSEVLDQNGESEQHPIPAHKPGLVIKKSAASTDVRVAVGKDGSIRKKSLPKLVKAAFKPPVASKGGKTSNDPKMPKLLKPHFVSPAFAKPCKEKCEAEKMSKSVTHPVTAEKDIALKKEHTLKRKAQCKDQTLVDETPKKLKEADKQHGQADNILSGNGL